MVEAKKYSATGENLGTVKLPESLFGVERKTANDILYEVINMYRANQRQGTSAVKTRGMVRGTTKKMYKQKGTGSARAGSRRSPIRVGGGMAFGPSPKNWYSKIPKKKKRLALKLALSQRAKENQVIVLDNIVFDKPNTKEALNILNKIAPERRNPLLVIDGSDLNIVKSFNNIPFMTTDRADGIYAYEILKSKCLILTVDALKKMEEVFSK